MVEIGGQQGTALQMGCVRRYKLDVYCQYFSDKLYVLGVPKQCPGMPIKVKQKHVRVKRVPCQAGLLVSSSISVMCLLLLPLLGARSLTHL